jgi:hypothetical protein
VSLLIAERQPVVSSDFNEVQENSGLSPIREKCEFLSLSFLLSEVWQNSDIKGIQLSRNKNISTILSADDQVNMSDSENNLQTAIYKLNKIITEYGLTTSTDKNKVTSFKGRDPTRSEIVINNKIT